ncbi:MAG: hypothetical protein ACRDU0_11980 [Mycobacterium sp.]
MRGDSGFSMIATVLSLAAAALLVALLLGSTLHSGGTSGTSVSNAPGVARSDNLAAQQALSTGLSSAAAAASNSGGLGSVDLSTLSASNPSITFVPGPSVNASTVSVTVSTDGNGGGTVTMSDRSSDGTCWLVWRSDAGATWYGAQTGSASCAAPAIASPPPPGPVSSSSIGWQPGGFPAG